MMVQDLIGWFRVKSALMMSLFLSGSSEFNCDLATNQHWNQFIDQAITSCLIFVFHICLCVCFYVNLCVCVCVYSHPSMLLQSTTTVIRTVTVKTVLPFFVCFSSPIPLLP